MIPCTIMVLLAFHPGNGADWHIQGELPPAVSLNYSQWHPCEHPRPMCEAQHEFNFEVRSTSDSRINFVLRRVDGRVFERKTVTVRCEP